MKSLFLKTILLFTFASSAQATSICLLADDAGQTPYESTSLTISIFNAAKELTSETPVQVSAVDSAPFGNVIKTYSDKNGVEVAQIHYLKGTPMALVVDDGAKELTLVFNRHLTISQGASCYDIGE